MSDLAVHLLESLRRHRVSLSIDWVKHSSSFCVFVLQADESISERQERVKKSLQFFTNVVGIDRWDESRVIVRPSGVVAGISGRFSLKLAHLCEKVIELASLPIRKFRVRALVMKISVEVVNPTGNIGSLCLDRGPSVSWGKSVWFWLGLDFPSKNERI